MIYGHDHVAAAAWVDDTLFLNPGTAGSPDDEDDGPTVAIVEKRPTGLAVLFVPLERRDAEEVPSGPHARDVEARAAAPARRPHVVPSDAGLGRILPV